MVSQGARSDTQSLVQAVCQAGDYTIDLQIEPEFEAGEMTLVGQIVSRATADEPLAGAPVRLMVRKKVVALAQTNRFGEFCLVSRLQSGLRLSVDIEVVDLRVGIPLGKLMAGLRL
jgi:hypothetical protein